MRFVRLNGSRLIRYKKVVRIIKIQNACNETFCADGAEGKKINFLLNNKTILKDASLCLCKIDEVIL